MDYFDDLKKDGVDENFLFAKYRELDQRHSDSRQSRSWFLDQVLHPHESQHTLKEVMEIFTSHDVRLVATSINQYKEYNTLDELYTLEYKQCEIAELALQQKRYFPGFFYVLGEKL